MESLPVRSHKDLILWQKAMDLAVAVHQVTTALPRWERFGLVCQMRRAAASVPSNVAEGSARTSTREFAHFLRIARGSLAVTQTHLQLAQRVGYLSDDAFTELDQQVDEVGRILNAFIAGLDRRVRLRSD